MTARTLVEVLGEHRLPQDGVDCTCGRSFWLTPPAAHEAHMAEQVLAWALEPERVERVARALWESDNLEMTPEWRRSAWADMGGSEPALERAEAVATAHTAIRALFEQGVE